METKNLSDNALIQTAERLVNAERGLLLTLLFCLEEIERRRLFTELGCGSLYEFCTSRLKLSEDQAQRRIAAMRVLREHPTIENEICSGLFNVATLGLIHSHFRRESLKDPTAQKKLLEEVRGKSKREVERLLLDASSNPASPVTDRIKAVPGGKSEFRFVARRELEGKVRNARGLLAHRLPNPALGELFETLCDEALKTLRKTSPAPARVAVRQSLRRQVFHRDQHRCTHCGSTHALELDHIVPKAKGGATSLENLRVLCRACNQRAAIREFGQAKMDPHLQ